MITKTKTKNSSAATYFAFGKILSSSQINKCKILLLAKEGKSKPNSNSKLGCCLRNYLNKSSAAYDSDFHKLIKDIRPDWFLKNSDVTKQKLINIAKTDGKRPSSLTKIGNRLSSYTTKKSGCFDRNFYKKIKAIRPDWFIFQSDLVSQKQKKIIEIAKKGLPKPIGSGLWSFFKNYRKRNPNSDFLKKINNLRPDWFVKQKDLSRLKKDEIIKMANLGLPRPKVTTKLGSCFNSYIRKSSASYDAKFTNLLKRKRPDWFITKQDLVKEKKNKLLKMARNGDPRPNQKDKKLGKLACFLSRVTSKKSYIYDPSFNKLIRKIRQDWFIGQSDKALIKKNQLLNIANKGSPKPKSPDRMAISFSMYTNPKNSCYDINFTESIRKIRPDWFLTRSNVADQKKKKIIKLAKSGANKPMHASNLGSRLYAYTIKNSSSYDKDFDAIIRKLRPDWFRKI